MSEVLKVKSSQGIPFDAVEWTGNIAAMPEWVSDFPVEEDPHHGTILRVGLYRVRVGSWVMRNSNSGHIFPLTARQFDEHYTAVGEA